MKFGINYIIGIIGEKMKPSSKEQCFLYSDGYCISKGRDCVKLCKDSIVTTMLDNPERKKLSYENLLNLYFSRIQAKNHSIIQKITIIISLTSLIVSVIAYKLK